MASPNKPTPPRRKFDQAFKAEALRMLDEGQSAVQVAKSLNVSDQLLHTWKHAHKKQTQKQVGTSELLAENERLKAQLKRAEMEREILKKSIAIFTQVLCQTLGVNRSGYYDWRKPTIIAPLTGPDALSAKANNTQQVKDLFCLHRRRYGSRRLVSKLKDRGVKVSRDFVRRVDLLNRT